MSIALPLRIAALALLTLILAACDSAPKVKERKGGEVGGAKQEAEKPEYQTGRAAFQKLYVAARNWSIDARPLHMRSSPQKGDKADGTASIWHAMFASPSKQATRSFTWSGAVGENAPERGVSPGSIGTFTASNISTQPFDPAFLKFDSVRALEIANQKGGAGLLKKDPAQPIAYSLNWEPRKSRLLWKVFYGTSERDYKLGVAVNASSGTFVKIEK